MTGVFRGALFLPRRDWCPAAAGGRQETYPLDAVHGGLVWAVLAASAGLEWVSFEVCLRMLSIWARIWLPASAAEVEVDDA